MSPRIIRFALDGMFNESKETFMARVAEVLSRLGDEHIEAIVNGVVKDVKIIDEELLKTYFASDEKGKEDFKVTKLDASLTSTPDAFQIICSYEYTAYKKDENDGDWNSSTTPDERHKFKFTRKSTSSYVYHLFDVPSGIAQTVQLFVI